jgi:hypothetical protein
VTFTLSLVNNGNDEYVVQLETDDGNVTVGTVSSLGYFSQSFESGI